MKALSVRQPWADLVARGAKAVETRSWRTSYRGALAIQASTTSSMYERARAMGSQFIRARGGDSFRRLPRGAVICTCRLVDCVPVDSAAVLRVLRERPGRRGRRGAMRTRPGSSDGRPRVPTAWSRYPCTVLDPFAGSGTTLAVAKRLGRRSWGIELSATYVARDVARRVSRSGVQDLEGLVTPEPLSVQGALPL
jgi:hypothetical protein